jgi:hypothetical protein
MSHKKFYTVSLPCRSVQKNLKVVNKTSNGNYIHNIPSAVGEVS